MQAAATVPVVMSKISIDLFVPVTVEVEVAVRRTLWPGCASDTSLVRFSAGSLCELGFGRLGVTGDWESTREGTATELSEHAAGLLIAAPRLQAHALTPSGVDAAPGSIRALVPAAHAT